MTDTERLRKIRAEIGRHLTWGWTLQAMSKAMDVDIAHLSMLVKYDDIDIDEHQLKVIEAHLDIER